MYKKSGFSFLEILIVIMIVGVLFVTFRSSFQIKNKDILYGQACIETIYGEINNFLHAAISSKSVNSWWTAIFPNTYIITFIPSTQSIELGYKDQGNIYTIYSSISITGNGGNYCSSNNYIILMSGNQYSVTIAKWLQETQNRLSFSLSGAGISTWANIFFQCDTTWTGCKTIAHFESDTRTVSIKKQICLTFTGNNCLDWDN